MRVLVQPYTHTLSHLSRPLSVAIELKKRGHEIIFAGESPKIRFIEREGFTVLSAYEPDPNVLFGNIRAGKLRFVSDDEISRMLEADLALYSEVKPDLVLTDGRFTAPISTHIGGLKHAAIVNVSSTEYRAVPYIPFFEWIPASLAKRDTALWRMLDRFNLSAEMLVFDSAMHAFTKLSRKFGLEKTITATNCLTGKDLTLLADVPEYFPTRNLPNDYHYIGPLTFKQGKDAKPSWWPPAKNGLPLVYITMGTTGVRSFFEILYSMCTSAEMIFVITTGEQTKNMQSLDGKIYIEDFIDGDLIMEACDLVVCHGGNGTIYQALQHGKPIIGIPTIPDQKFNMRRVEILGLGKTLSWNDFSRNPGSLLNLIRTVLNDRSFFQNAAQFSKILGRCNAAKSSADIIENAFA